MQIDIGFIKNVHVDMNIILEIMKAIVRQQQKVFVSQLKHVVNVHIQQLGIMETIIIQQLIIVEVFKLSYAVNVENVDIVEVHINV